MELKAGVFCWIFVLLEFTSQIIYAVCPNSFFCMQTRSRSKERFYNGTDFPNFAELFRKDNIPLEAVTTLIIQATNIETINPKELGKLNNLTELYIDSCKRLTVPPYAFQNNAKLTSIQIRNCEIKKFDFLAFDGAFQKQTVLGELNLMGNRLTSFPSFSRKAPGLKDLYLDKNPIRQMTNRSLYNLDQIQKLFVRGTSLKFIGNDVFNKKRHLVEFDVSGSTSLSEISNKAFRGATGLRTLNLARTSLTTLPSTGLDNLVTLNLEGVETIVTLSDDVINLRKLRNVFLAQRRRYLCCAFKHKRKESIHTRNLAGWNFTKNCNTTAPRTTPLTTAANTTPRTATMTAATTTKSNISLTTTEDPWGGGGWGPRKRSLLFFGEWVPSNKISTSSAKTSHPFLTDDNFGKNTVSHATAIFDCSNHTNRSYLPDLLKPVNCYPEPDALRPCDDIMGNVFLTSVSWIVSFIAILTNAVVFGVLVMSRRHFTVTKFLIINLAFADLCLGLYLFILTCASIETTGKYYNSMQSWQYDGGCDVIGFLAIFSSELSMLILTIITIERYLAIVYAVYLQKRLTLRYASYLAATAWFVAILLAFLPLVGVNNYHEVAICLPFSISSTQDIAYLGFVFCFNSFLFVVIMGCYLRIYRAVGGQNPEGRPPAEGNDSSIAKRIALLVFTDFACWLPIAIIGMIAAAGHSSSINMTVEKSKYLLVIFFPINSICNPFLYALSTRIFKREFFTVLAQCGFCQERLHQYNTNTYTGNSQAQKMSLKARRGTETINLSLVGPANRSSTPKNGPANGATGILEVGSPTRNPLIGDGIPGSSSQNNNLSKIKDVKVNFPEDIHGPNDSQELASQTSPPHFDRLSSRTPLSEHFSPGGEDNENLPEIAF